MTPSLRDIPWDEDYFREFICLIEFEYNMSTRLKISRKFNIVWQCVIRRKPSAFEVFRERWGKIIDFCALSIMQRVAARKFLHLHHGKSDCFASSHPMNRWIYHSDLVSCITWTCLQIAWSAVSKCENEMMALFAHFQWAT